MIDYESIEKYISNELTEQEKLAFKQQLQTDAGLAEAYAMYVSINNTMQTKAADNRDAFIETTTNFNKEYFYNSSANIIPPKKNNVRRMYFLAAAAAAVLLLVLTIVPFGSKNYTNDELYAMYNVNEKVEEITRGDNKDSIFNKAAQLYNVKKYNEAIPYLAKVKDSSSQALFLYGVCNMETNNKEIALASFETLISGTSTFKEKAELYKALVYLKANELDKCKLQLKTIKETSSYSKQAKELLKKIN